MVWGTIGYVRATICWSVDSYSMLLNYFTTPLINIIYLQSKIQQAKVANNCLQEVYVVNKEEKGQLKDLSFKQLDLKGVSHRFRYQ